jgi:hypothetical protein
MNLKNTIKAVVCETMPTAAIASGFISPVSTAEFVKQVSERFPYEQRKDIPLGITKLTEWLAANGVVAGRTFIDALRTAWIMEELRTESHKQG